MMPLALLACPIACPVNAGEAAPADGWFYTTQTHANAMTTVRNLDAVSLAEQQCREREASLLFRLDTAADDLDACRFDLASALKLEPPPPPPEPEPSAWGLLWPVVGAACVGGGLLLDRADVGTGWSVAAGGACLGGAALGSWWW